MIFPKAGVIGMCASRARLFVFTRSRRPGTRGLTSKGHGIFLTLDTEGSWLRDNTPEGRSGALLWRVAIAVEGRNCRICGV
jgi:hypothetical protein